VHYNFSTVEAMKGEIDEGKFVEYAEVHGNYYGTSVKSVESVQGKNLICLLDIDIQGAQNVKKSTLDALYLFVAPPSMEELEKRLRGRGTESEEAMQRRLANAKGELDYGMKEGNFDAVLVNNDLDETFERMVRKFKEWYPELLEEEKGQPQDSRNEAALEDVPPPVCDPLSFPKTDEGLKALLTEVDKDCPLEEYVSSELNYQASNVNISAGKTLDIPLPPVEQDGSKIEWSVTLVDEYNEQLDINFGLVVIVDGEEVVAREMGRILSPSQSADNGNDDDASSSASGEEREKVSAKGKFTVANSAPVTVIIKLDNSYAWIKPKKINYSFNIIAPVDDNMVKRSLRAKSVMPKILEGQDALNVKKQAEISRGEALRRIQSEMEEKMTGLSKQIDEDKKSIESVQKSADKAEEEAKAKATKIKDALSAVKKEEQSIDECTSAITALEAECAKLKKKWEELKVERGVREEEKLKLEREAEQSKEERIALQEKILLKKEEEQVKLQKVEGNEKERNLLQINLDDLEKEKNARAEEEEKYTTELKFLQRQLDAIKLRFIEPKS